MATEARGIVAREVGQAAPIERIVLEDPGPGEVLVRVLASGVCHTDLHFQLGSIGTLPVLMGHEGAGIVEAVGPGVESPKVGDYVVLAWRAPCGQCRFCRIGQLHLCAASLNAQPRQKTPSGDTIPTIMGLGTFATHTVVAALQAVPIPREVPPEQASLIGCGVMTGIGAVFYTAGVRPGSTVAVFGSGAVGTSVIQGARLAHAAKIIAVDLEPRKLEWATQFGATHTVNASQDDPVARIKELTDGYGVNYVFEAVGNPIVLTQALRSRDLAGVAVLIGVPSADAVIEFPAQEYFGMGGSLRVSWYGDCLPTRDFPLLADLYLKGELKLDEMITRKIALEEVQDAFEAMERGETLRSVIAFDGK
ncbi:MAG: Zn-dependent alcohol dehydrogenase [Chloroflexota bacterium]|nr:Zn-dependent alcohol dehydrogenase [Chloroflexota bacterium]